MALTKVTYSMIQGAVLNVRNFGADPDSADNHAAFTAAIAAALLSPLPAIYVPA